MSRLILIFAMLAALCAAGVCGTISDAKLLPDGSPVSLSGKIVTYATTDVFYIEDANQCGIRVQMPNHGLAEGSLASVSGTIRTNANWERYIEAGAVSSSGSGTVQPLSMNNRILGGGDWNYNPANGAGQRGISFCREMNNIGLLVRVWGYSGTVDGSRFQIDDGSRVVVTVQLDSGRPPLPGSFVVVTGVSSCEFVNAKVRRLVRVSSSAKIEVVTYPPMRYTGPMISIPAGSFLMGNSGVGNDKLAADLGYANDEKPQHSVYVSAFQIGLREVTRGEYRQFINAGGYDNPTWWSSAGWDWRIATQRTKPDNWNAQQNWGSPPGQFSQTDNYPVVGVSFYEAEAFCNWAGCRLPSEAEWEKAARWNNITPRVYPWGDAWDSEKCNNWYDALFDGYRTAPVGSYPLGSSFHGCLDMIGNVWEWCSDWYSFYYYSQTPYGGWVDPQGPSSGTGRVLRGGSWADGEFARCAFRQADDPTFSSNEVGFRVAR